MPIEARQDAGRYAVNFDGGQFRGFSQIFRHGPDEITNASRRLKNTAAPKAHPANCFPDCLDHENFREVGIDDTTLGAFVVLAQYFWHGLGSRLPRRIFLIRIERLRNTAPSGVTVKDGALIVGRSE